MEIKLVSCLVIIGLLLRVSTDCFVLVSENKEFQELKPAVGDQLSHLKFNLIFPYKNQIMIDSFIKNILKAEKYKLPGNFLVKKTKDIEKDQLSFSLESLPRRNARTFFIG